MTVRRPTIADVAQRAGVSKGLVSFVFNDRPGVAPSTRARILAVAAELGWRPNLGARALAVQRSFAVGLVVRRDPQVLAADPFFPAFMAGAESVLARRDHVLVLSLVADSEAELRTYRTLAADRRVDVVLLSDLRPADPRFALLDDLGVPAVAVGYPETRGVVPAVDLDDDHGTRASVAHLVALGHEQIGYVAGDPALLHGVRRRASFAAAMVAHGLSADAVEVTDFSAASGASATARLLDRRPCPTAIVYASDPMAIAGVGLLQQRGLNVPDDVSVTSFDGSDLARYVHPPLTTVVSDPLAWGGAAADLALRLLAGDHVDDVQLPPAELVVRRSTGPPPIAAPTPTTPTPPAPTPTTRTTPTTR